MRQYAASDYDSRAVEAAHRVLLELSRVLGEYEDDFAVVGGWVPPLLMPDSGHIGSTDVDLALDQESLQEPRYTSIRGLLVRSGYRPDPHQNFVFLRDVMLGDEAEPDPVVVEVDLVAGEYGLAGKRRQSQPIQDVRARKARGADLVFDYDLAERVEVEGQVPSGAQLRTRIRVAGPVPFLVMKANAIARRDKPKDAYDVWFLLANHPAGPDGLAAAVAEHAGHGLVREALAHLDAAFASTDHVGPRSFADFLELEPRSEEDDRIRQDAFQRVRHLLARAGLTT